MGSQFPKVMVARGNGAVGSQSMVINICHWFACGISPLPHASKYFILFWFPPKQTSTLPTLIPSISTHGKSDIYALIFANTWTLLDDNTCILMILKSSNPLYLN